MVSNKYPSALGAGDEVPDVLPGDGVGVCMVTSNQNPLSILQNVCRAMLVYTSSNSNRSDSQHWDGHPCQDDVEDGGHHRTAVDQWVTNHEPGRRLGAAEAISNYMRDPHVPVRSRCQTSTPPLRWMICTKPTSEH